MTIQSTNTFFASYLLSGLIYKPRVAHYWKTPTQYIVQALFSGCNVRKSLSVGFTVFCTSSVTSYGKSTYVHHHLKLRNNFPLLNWFPTHLSSVTLVAQIPDDARQGGHPKSLTGPRRELDELNEVLRGVCRVDDVLHGHERGRRDHAGVDVENGNWLRIGPGGKQQFGYKDPSWKRRTKYGKRNHVPRRMKCKSTSSKLGKPSLTGMYRHGYLLTKKHNPDFICHNCHLLNVPDFYLYLFLLLGKSSPSNGMVL